MILLDQVLIVLIALGILFLAYQAGRAHGYAQGWRDGNKEGNRR